MLRACAVTATVVAVFAGVAELIHRWAARAAAPSDEATEPSTDVRTEAIIVLGYRSGRSGRPHPVQRWRCQIAVRSMDPNRESTLVMTGWKGEARVMAGYVTDVLGVPVSQIVCEEQARTTRENIAYSLPMVRDRDVIKIASDPLHTKRALRYALQVRPDLADRLEPAATYRPGEHPLLKVGTALYETLRPLARHSYPARHRYRDR